MKTLALLTVLVLGPIVFQDPAPPAPPAPQDGHRWLQQLVGEWSVRAEATMAPGAEPMVMEGTESVRAIGDLWILGEGKATIAGTPMTSILTLGYDGKQKVFVGTWIDSVQTHLWHYRGTLDGAKKVLTLDTEGPSMTDPDKTVAYRDAYEIVSADQKRLSSSVRGPDGKWTTFMRAEYRRKK